MLMKTLLDGGFLDGNCMTVTGPTLGENIDQVTWNPTRRASMTSRRRFRRPAA
jgi:dihydroxy-acid dehydratase